MDCFSIIDFINDKGITMIDLS